MGPPNGEKVPQKEKKSPIRRKKTPSYGERGPHIGFFFWGQAMAYSCPHPAGVHACNLFSNVTNLPTQIPFPIT